MSKDKYSNGMYKTTSSQQNTTSQSIFRAFVENPTHNRLESMGVDFNQVSGNCEYTYYFLDYMSAYYLVVNRKGIIVESGFTTR